MRMKEIIKGRKEGRKVILMSRIWLWYDTELKSARSTSKL